MAQMAGPGFQLMIDLVIPWDRLHKLLSHPVTTRSDPDNSIMPHDNLTWQEKAKRFSLGDK